MNWTIVLFLAAGALFGLVSHPKRHLFSEGSTRPGRPGEGGFAESRLWWTLQCAFLWPVLLGAGLYTLAFRRWSRRR
ncbi:MAG: hypothetical protein H6932_07715 [Burkholderiaceae bacterium]|nr:hypothetical protein [Burkholderiaceae bacterium]